MHTQEPWYIENGAIYANHGDLPVEIIKADRNEPFTSPVERDDNVKRVLACVNFCAGIETLPAEETLAGLIDELIEFVGLVPGEVYHDPRTFVDTMRRRFEEFSQPEEVVDENTLISRHEQKIADEETASVLDPQNAHIGSQDAYLTEQPNPFTPIETFNPFARPTCPKCGSHRILIGHENHCMDCFYNF